MRSSTVLLCDEYSPYLPNIELDPDVFHKFSVVGHKMISDEVEGETFRVVEYDYRAGVKIMEKGGNQDPNDDGLMEVVATFSAGYILIGDEPSEEALKEFGRFNVGLNVWPYWREFLASTMTRLHFPPITLPFYSLNLTEEETPKELGE